MTAFRFSSRSCALLMLLLPTLADGADEFERVGTFGTYTHFLAPDARAIAMGTAVTAIPKGPTVSYWNLGSLGLPGPMGGFSYSTRRVGDRYHFYSVAGNRDGIGVGGHLTGMRDKRNVRSIYDPSDIRSVEISEYFGLVGAGIDMGRFLQILPEGLEWGTGLGVGFAKNKIGTFEGDGWDMDLGTILSYRLPLERSLGATALVLRTGYVLRNLQNRRLEFDGGTAPLRREDRLGLAATMELADNSRFGPLFQGTVSLERRGLFSQRDNGRNLIGGEITVAGVLSLRAGNIWDDTGDDERESNWGFGFGLEPGNPISSRIGAQLDYVDAEQNVGPDFEQVTASVWIAF